MSPRIAALVSTVLFFACGVETSLADDPVGVVSGEFSVSPSGAASYTVPIDVPNGPGGMQPELAFMYGSQGANGSMGVGWAMSGTSAIVRCPSNLEQDGVIRGVKLDRDDKLCLGAARLVAVSGNYGEQGTRYRTETESFARIIQRGGHLDSPNVWFFLQNKSGISEFYGSETGMPNPNANASFHLPGTPVASSWSIARKEDTLGNRINYNYDPNFTQVGQRLTEIVYGSNLNQKIEFTYEPRPDTSTKYLHGVAVEVSERLKNVKVLVGAEMHSEWKLDYSTSVRTKRSFLETVQKCSQSNGAYECLRATEFENGDTNAWSFDQPLPTGISTWDNVYLPNQVADFNGDGLSDFLVWHAPDNNYRYNLYLANSNGFEPVQETPIEGYGGSRTANILVGDFTGDGLPDVLGYHRPFLNSQYNLYVNNGNGFNEAIETVIDPFDYPHLKPKVADFNGDGLMDVMVHHYPFSNLHYNIYFSNGNGFDAAVPTVIDPPANANSENILVGDFTGDGLPDVLGYHEPLNNYRYNLYVNRGRDFATGNGFAEPVATDIRTWDDGRMRTQVADFNADGLQDVIVWFAPYNNYKLNIYYSNGNGFEPAVDSGTTAAATKYRSSFIVSDFNGDNLPDIMAWHRPFNNHQYNIYFNNGSGFDDAVPTGFNSWSNHKVDDQLGDFNGDGHLDALVWHRPQENHQFNLLYGSASNIDRITKITSPTGNVTEIDYAAQSDPTAGLYTKDPVGQYPVVNYCAPVPVVSEFRTSDGRGGWAGSSYEYGGGRVHLRGRGLQGHRYVKVTDSQTGIVEHTEYHQAFPLTGMVKFSETKTATGDLLSRADNSYTVKEFGSGDQTRYFPYASSSTSTSYELAPRFHAIKSTRTTNTYSNTDVEHGNVTTVKVETWAGTPSDYGNDLHSVLTRNWYYDSPGTQWEQFWLLGRLSRSEVTHSKPGVPDKTRTSSFQYNSSNGLLTQEVIEPGTPDALTTNYTHDNYGNVTRKEISGLGIATRDSRTQYSGDGRFVTRVVNALNHDETMQYDSRLGVRTEQTGPNGLRTYWDYDVFGRATKETRPDGTWTETKREWCTPSLCPIGNSPHTASFRVHTRSSNGAEAFVVHDQLERKIASFSKGFDGEWVAVYREFDAQGRQLRESTPHFIGDPHCWTSTQYDLIDRPVLIDAPTSQHQCSGRVTESIYNGLTTTQIDAKQNQTVKVDDVMGRTVQVTDPAYGVLQHQYDALGHLIATTDPEGNTVQIQYDLRGNKTAMSDPNMGSWTYDYNVLDQLVSQTDAKGQTVTMQYDLLGRMVQRTEPEGVTSWQYDNHWIGALTSVTSPEGYQRSHQYDGLGRPSNTITTIDGTSYTSSVTYDNQSRVAETIYPSGVATLNSYHPQHGYLIEVRDAADWSLYWQLDHVDALGNVDMWTLGNGISTTRVHDQARGHINAIVTGGGLGADVQNLSYNWDRMGNLIARLDERPGGKAEHFEYDDLYRLTRSTLDGVENLAMQYSAAGNIEWKSDAGSYLYGSNAGPNAVTSVTGDRDADYAYDANGSMVAGNGRNVEWTSYNKPASITMDVDFAVNDSLQPSSNPTTGTNRIAAPAYDADGQFKVWWSPAEAITIADAQCQWDEYAQPSSNPTTASGQIAAPAQDVDGDFTVYWSDAPEPASKPAMCQWEEYSQPSSNPTTGPAQIRVPSNDRDGEFSVYWSQAPGLTVPQDQCPFTEYSQWSSNPAPNNTKNRQYLTPKDVDGNLTLYWSESELNCLVCVNKRLLQYRVLMSPIDNFSTSSGAQEIYRGGARQLQLNDLPAGTHYFRVYADWSFQDGLLATQYRTESYTHNRRLDVDGIPSCSASTRHLEVQRASNASFSDAVTVTTAADGAGAYNAVLPVGEHHFRVRPQYRITSSTGDTRDEAGDWYLGSSRTVVEGTPQCESEFVAYQLAHAAPGGNFSTRYFGVNQQRLITGSNAGLNRFRVRAKYEWTETGSGQTAATYSGWFSGNGNTDVHGQPSCTAEFSHYRAEQADNSSFNNAAYIYPGTADHIDVNTDDDHAWFRVKARYRVTNSLGQEYDIGGGWFSGENNTEITSQITQTNGSEFYYGPERSRFKQVQRRYKDGVEETTTIHYVGNYEVHIKPGVTEQRHFIRAGGQVIAIDTQRSNGADTLHYLHRDHLGSIDVVTDADGDVVERTSFDAFGKRRTAGWEADPMDILWFSTEFVTRRGFTGHEQLDHVGLIHMNGRVYDPMLGRFLSADPNVQFPNSTQGLNRYTYVNNNPLSYTDPSGFFLAGLVKAVGAASAWRKRNTIERKARHEFRREGSILNLYAQVYIAVGTAVIAGTGCVHCAAAFAAYTTALYTRAMGADWETAAIAGAYAGASAAVSAYTGGKFDGWVQGMDAGAKRFTVDVILRSATHGVSQGAIARAQGGSFRDSALSGFAAGVAGHTVIGRIDGTTVGARLLRTAAAAAIGGTAAKMGGGKFANGAVTGAFVHLFNAEIGYERMKAEIEAGKARLKRNAEIIVEGIIDSFVEPAGATGELAAVSPKGLGASLSMSEDGSGSLAPVWGAGAYARGTLDYRLLSFGDTTGLTGSYSGCAGGGFGGCLSFKVGPGGFSTTVSVGVVFGVGGKFQGNGGNLSYDF